MKSNERELRRRIVRAERKAIEKDKSGRNSISIWNSVSDLRNNLKILKEIEIELNSEMGLTI